MTTVVLYNPFANNNRAAEQSQSLRELLPEDELEFLELYQCMNASQRRYFTEFMKSLKEDDERRGL